jgi:hypothetical protein
MRLKKIEWRNVGPFGNKLQTVDFPDGGGLWMVLGKNGNGKCHNKDTKINILIENEEVKKQFIDFLKK